MGLYDEFALVFIPLSGHLFVLCLDYVVGFCLLWLCL